MAIFILSVTSNTLLRLSGRFETNVAPILVTKMRKIKKKSFFQKRLENRDSSLSLEGVPQLLTALRSVYTRKKEQKCARKLIFFSCQMLHVSSFRQILAKKHKNQIVSRLKNVFFVFLFLS